MACHQCGRPSIVEMEAENGKIPLCLNCYERIEAIRHREIEVHERQLNYIAQEMEAISGMPGLFPRFEPRPRPVHTGHTFNSINIHGSTVGVANIGPLRQVDTAITAISGGAEQELAAALKSLTEAIARAQLDDAQRVDALETLAALSEEATKPQVQRRKAVASRLLRGLREVVSVSADLATIAHPLWPVIAAAFGIAVPAED